MRFNVLAIALSVATLAFISGCSKEVSFKQDVKPIINDTCLECHDGKGEGSEESGLILNTYDDLMRGTKFGQVVVPGDSESSTLYRLISHKAEIRKFTCRRILKIPLHPRSRTHSVTSKLK